MVNFTKERKEQLQRGIDIGASRGGMLWKDIDKAYKDGKIGGELNRVVVAAIAYLENVTESARTGFEMVENLGELERALGSGATVDDIFALLTPDFLVKSIRAGVEGWINELSNEDKEKAWKSIELLVGSGGAFDDEKINSIGGKLRAIIAETSFTRFPSSVASDGIRHVLGMSGDEQLKRLILREQEISHGKKTDLLAGPPDKPKARKISTTTKVYEISYVMENIEYLLDNKGTIKKVYDFILSRMSNAFSQKGDMVKAEISFPLQALVDAGIYGDLESARAGFINARRTLTSIHVEGKMRRGKRTVSQGGGPLFTWGEIVLNQCKITINPKIAWGLFGAEYAFVPSHTFKLNKNANILEWEIFRIARQRYSKIERDGKFTISMRAIQARLNLPDEAETKNPRRDIREPIEAAIEEVEEANNGAEKLKLTPYRADGEPMDDGDNIKAFLEGKLVVNFDKEYARLYAQLGAKRDKEIKEAIRKAAKRKKKTQESNSGEPVKENKN